MARDSTEMLRHYVGIFCGDNSLYLLLFNRKGKRGVNPQTGEELQIPAKKVAKFRAGKGFEGEHRIKKSILW